MTTPDSANLDALIAEICATLYRAVRHAKKGEHVAELAGRLGFTLDEIAIVIALVRAGRANLASMVALRDMAVADALAAARLNKGAE